MYIRIFTIKLTASFNVGFPSFGLSLIFRIKMKMRKTDIFWSFIETENILFKIKCQFT